MILVILRLLIWTIALFLFCGKNFLRRLGLGLGWIQNENKSALGFQFRFSKLEIVRACLAESKSFKQVWQASSLRSKKLYLPGDTSILDATLPSWSRDGSKFCKDSPDANSFSCAASVAIFAGLLTSIAKPARVAESLLDWLSSVSRMLFARFVVIFAWESLSGMRLMIREAIVAFGAVLKKCCCLQEQYYQIVSQW